MKRAERRVSLDKPGLRSIPRRVLTFVAASTLTLSGLFAPADATNGNGWSITCSNCVTSSAFQSQATSYALEVKASGTYQMVSNSAAMTAYYKVTTTDYLGVFSISSIYPVDGNGNSLAGQSEANLENAFTSIDIALWGSSRGQPIYLNMSTVYQGSFINSEIAEVGPGIDAALVLTGTTWAQLPVGTTANGDVF